MKRTFEKLENEVLARSRGCCELCLSSHPSSVKVVRILEDNLWILPENLIALCDRHTKMAKQEPLKKNLKKGLIRFYKWKGLDDQEILDRTGLSSHKKIESGSITITSIVLLHFVGLYKQWQEQTGQRAKKFRIGDFR